jgi:hypothetical protein
MYAIDDREPAEFQLSIKEAIPGYHNLTYWSIDKAGNIAEPGRLFFYVDSEAPVTAIKIDGPNYDSGEKTYVCSTTSISLVTVDDGCGVTSIKVNVDYRGYIDYSTPLRFNTSGAHTIVYRSVDILGNVEAEKILNIVVDMQPPVTKAMADRILSNRTINVVFDANDSASGVNRTFFRVAREKMPAGDYQIGMTVNIEAAPDGSMDGNYTVEFYSVDELNNTEPARKIDVTIDTQVFLKLDFSGTPTVDKDRFIISGRTEPGAKMKIDNNSVAVSSDGSFTFEVGLGPGMNKATISITDPAGNIIDKPVDIDYKRPIIAAGGFQIVFLGTLVVAAAAAGIFLYIYKWKKHTPEKKKRVLKKPVKRVSGHSKSGNMKR